MTSAAEKVTGRTKPSSGGAGGGFTGGAAASTSVAWNRAGSPTKGDLVPVRASAGSDIWLSATAPSGQSNAAVFIPTAPSIDTATAGRPVFRTAALGVGGSAIGLGALLDVGGAWGGSTSSYNGFSQVFPQAFGLGFEGYHQGFSQADPKAWAPPGGPDAPPASWNPSGSYYHGGDNPSGGPGGPPNNGPNDGPGDNHNSDHHGSYDDNGHQSAPVTATPEPGTVVLLATGFLALVPVVRRRRRA